MKIIVAIVLGVLIAADTCVDDIKAATGDMKAIGMTLIKALSDCMTHTSCTPDIESVVGNLDAAKKSLNDAVTDCSGEGSTCTDDIAYLATKLGDLSQDIPDAVKDCGTNVEKCLSDLVKTVQDTTNAVSYIFKTASECSFHTSMKAISVETPSEQCNNATRDAKEELMTMVKNVLPAIIPCFREKKNCDQILGKLEEALESVKNAIMICSGIPSSCLDAFKTIVEEVGATRTALENAVGDCSFGFTKSCKRDLRKGATSASKAIGEILALIPHCKPEINQKISA